MLLMNNCIKELTGQIRQAQAPITNHHVSLMRSLVEVAMQLRMGPTYTNVISLLQKVSRTRNTSSFKELDQRFSLADEWVWCDGFPQALEGLLEGMNPPPNDPDLFVSFRDCHILILRALQVKRNVLQHCYRLESVVALCRDGMNY